MDPKDAILEGVVERLGVMDVDFTGQGDTCLRFVFLLEGHAGVIAFTPFLESDLTGEMREEIALTRAGDRIAIEFYTSGNAYALRAGGGRRRVRSFRNETLRETSPPPVSGRGGVPASDPSRG